MEPELILVDSDDSIVGHAGRAQCHDGRGLLHRAFSIYLFDEDGRWLLQQRSDQKRLWPGFWSNSCCSHPRRGEQTQAAAESRVVEELGLPAAVRFAFKYEYQASFETAGSEHELCSVFTGELTAEPQPNADEVASVRLVETEELERWIERTPGDFSPWFQLAWRRVAQLR